MNTFTTTASAARSMAPIERDDMILATLEGNGRILATVHKTGFGNVDDVTRFALALAGQFTGLAKLTVRNKTQGWHMTQCLASRRQPAPRPFMAWTPNHTASVPARALQPRQLAIEW